MRLTGALAESDRCKNELLVTLSHELRNPLAPVRNLVHILRAKAVATPDLQWIPEFIESQIGQMNRLVDDLTEISGVGCGAQIAVVCERHGAEIEIRFHDSGAGIPAAMLERIFSPFTRLDRAEGEESFGSDPIAPEEIPPAIPVAEIKSDTAK